MCVCVYININIPDEPPPAARKACRCRTLEKKKPYVSIFTFLTSKAVKLSSIEQRLHTLVPVKNISTEYLLATFASSAAFAYFVYILWYQ